MYKQNYKVHFKFELKSILKFKSIFDMCCKC